MQLFALKILWIADTVDPQKPANALWQPPDPSISFALLERELE